MTAALSFLLRHANDTAQLGAVLGGALGSRSAHPGPVFLLLSGELGAGKTTLTRGLAEGLGADPAGVASPTFTIRMDHAGDERALVHIDAWRVGTEDLEQIGFDELLSGEAVVAVEWPERIAAALPARHVRLAIEHVDPIEPDEEPARRAQLSLHGFTAAEERRIADALSLLVRAPRLREPRCPSCGKATPAEGGLSDGTSGGAAPFCSPRCRLADLGDWLAMRHRIAGKDTPDFDE